MQRIGRLDIDPNAAAPDSAVEGADSTGLLVIRQRDDAPVGPRSMRILGFILVLNLGVAALAALVRTPSAIGGAVMTLIALLWLLSTKPRTRDDITLECGERLRCADVDVASDAVRSVGIGYGDASSRTVWVSVAGAGGRTLVLSGLAEAEAEAVATALRTALSQQQPAAA